MMLPRSFFNRPAPQVARDLLGMRLVRLLPEGGRIEARITETEAYEGTDDLASHASRGRTARNAVMFGPPGHLYLYLCYGMHWMLNITTGPAGHPAAVLLRGTADATGPGRLTRRLRLDGGVNTLPLGRRAGLWIAPPADGQAAPAPAAIRALPRVGVEYAGPVWSAIPWRFAWNPP